MRIKAHLVGGALDGEVVTLLELTTFYESLWADSGAGLFLLRYRRRLFVGRANHTDGYQYEFESIERVGDVPEPAQ